MELTQHYTKGNRDVDNNWYVWPYPIFGAQRLIPLQVSSHHAVQGALVS